jgi:hypothetical protein
VRRSKEVPLKVAQMLSMDKSFTTSPMLKSFHYRNFQFRLIRAIVLKHSKNNFGKTPNEILTSSMLIL